MLTWFRLGLVDKSYEITSYERHDVVLHRPQTLIPSSRGTTSSGPDRVSSGTTWCFTARKPLLLRRGAPRPRGRIGIRPVGRGASPLANPYSFVTGHHVHGPERKYERHDVVLHRSQTLIPSSRGTTSSAPDRTSTGGPWCFTARKPLFLRRGAPRPQGRIGFRAARRGASPPANPYYFVAGHHVLGTGYGFDRHDVVLHHSQTLIPSSRGTTSTAPNGNSDNTPAMKNQN